MDLSREGIWLSGGFFAVIHGAGRDMTLCLENNNNFLKYNPLINYTNINKYKK